MESDPDRDLIAIAAAYLVDRIEIAPLDLFPVFPVAQLAKESTEWRTVGWKASSRRGQIE